MNEEITTARFIKPSWYQWAMMFGSSFGFAVATVLLMLHLQTEAIEREGKLRLEADMKWCSIVVTLDDVYKQTPPTTPVGKNMAMGIKDLRDSLKCPPMPLQSPIK